MNPEDACTYHVGPYLLVTFLIKATIFSKNTLENEYEDEHQNEEENDDDDDDDPTTWQRVGTRLSY